MLSKTTKTLIAFVLVIIFSGCGSNQQQVQGPAAAIPVTVEEAKAVHAPYYDEYPGTVVALNQTDLRAQVSGYVTGIYFQDGQKVRKGQRLYAIDQQVYNATYQQALSNLQVQETNLVKAQKDAERYHELDKKDAIAKQQVDYADAALDAAKRQVEAARANVNAVRANVSFANIVAPFSGTIGISQVRSGTSVVAGQTVLNTISTDNPMGVDFTVDQKEVFRFTQFQQAKKNATDSIFTLAFGNDKYSAAGKIHLIDRAVDAQTGTIKVRLIFPNDDGVLRAGMSATVRVLNNASQQSITVPYKAITEQLGDFFVYVVGDSNKVFQRKLVLGKQVGLDIIVKEGLQQGEKVVTQGAQNLREGAVITSEAKVTKTP
jgi:membrane fusion protein, multidrug efflux system